MNYTFDDADAEERHTTQYFEMFGNRAIYHRGWTAVARHKFPWQSSTHGLDEDVWELYDVERDWTQSHDVAAEQPAKLAELQRLFLIQAARFNVLPMDVRSIERFNPDLAGRPTLLTGNSQIFHPGMRRLTENAVVSIKNKSHTVTADVVVPDGGAEGVIAVQGGAFGGWSLYLAGGALCYAYNLLGVRTDIIRSQTPLEPGTHEVRMHFAYDGGGLAKGGTVTLYDGETQLTDGRVTATMPMTISVDESVDIGRDLASPVSTDYGTDNTFTGTINWVRLDIGDDDHSHLADPHQLINNAMLKQ